MILPPPASFDKRPRIIDIDPGTRLVRVYRPRFGNARTLRHYGPLFRFDHHPLPVADHPEFGVLYLAMSLSGAVAEAFGDRGFVDKRSDRRIAVLRVTKALRVIDLVGAAARRLGLDQRIGTTTDYAATQAWARRLFDDEPVASGIRWRGRQAGTIVAVMNQRIATGDLAVDADLAIGADAIWPRIARAAQVLSLDLV